MDKKRIIVTGGTDGIGLALVKKLIRKRSFSIYSRQKCRKRKFSFNQIKTQN